MATVKTPASAWVEAALPLLATGGPEAVRVEQLAASLGVTKGGFYWHFPNRAALLDAVLAHWERVAVEDVIEEIEALPSTPRRKLGQLFELAFAFAIDGDGLHVELAVRDWARRDPSVADRLRGVDERRMAYLRKLFRQISDDDLDAEARSLTAYSMFVGQHFLATGHGALERGDVLRRALDHLLR